MSGFTPYFCLISGITNGQQPTVTFTSMHPYVAGEYISFRVSQPFGMVQINNLKARVLTVPTPTSVTINLDTSNFTPFIYPVTTTFFPPMAVPAGSGIQPNPSNVTTYTSPSTVILEDAFDQVPPS